MEKKKSMSRIERLHREKVMRYSIRKVSFGAASVAVAALFMFLGNGAVAAAEPSVTPDTGEKEILNLPSDKTKDNNYQSGTNAKDIVTTNHEVVVENSITTESKPTKAETLNKETLTNLIEEIEGKFAKGIYASKTEDSVNQLKTALDKAKAVLNNAKTQVELSQAHAKLATATTQLKTKPEEKKEAPAVDTTNGKATVSKVASNTAKAKESNSIANSGSRDERNGKEINKANAFRTDAATTDTDPAANQTYTAPAADADLNTLVKALLALDPTVENNSKLSQNMDSLGDSKQVAKGTVKEITEFGGWTAVDGGVFAIARRTEEGVYPLETINSTLDDTVWLQEQAFDRDTEYTLLLSKSRTRSNRDEVAYDNSVYKPTGEGGGITKNLARYKGIEKTFTAYSTKEGSDVIVKFKPGYVGDSEGKKARYKVEVYSIEGTTETKIYETVFDPSQNINDAKQIVTAAKDGTNNAKIKISDSSNSTTIDSGVDNTVRKNFIGKREAEKLMAQSGNKPNGTAGTFTSKPIALPKGADHYKVRVSLADQDKTGMSYQAWDDKYSVPVTGADFSIAQDTSNVARNLLQRIYDKLKATELADKNGKTSQTIQDYEAELEKVKTLLANPAARTPNFKQALQDLLAKQSGLKTDKTGLTNSKAELDALVNEDPTLGKTTDTAKAYNAAKEAAKTEITAALAVINDDNATPEQVSAALEKVNAKKTALQQAKDGLIEAATAEEKAKLQADADSLVKADTTGKTPNSIEAYNTKYESIKAQLEAAKADAEKVLAKGNNATKEEVKAAQAKVDAVKTELETAKNLLVEAATTEEKTKLKTDSDALKKADTTGKTVDSIKAYEAEFEKLQAQLEEAKAEADKVLTKGNNATKEEVKVAQAKVDAAKTALDKAAESLKDLDRDAAKKEIADAAKKATDAIEASTSLTPEQKAEEKAKVAKEAKDATDAIDKATTEEGINSAKDNGKLAIEKEAAITAINAEKAAKEQEIDNNSKLSDEEKAAAKAEVAKAATEAVEAIKKAATQAAVEAAKAKGEAAIKAVNPVGKEKALEAIQTTTEAKLAEIDKNTSLSAEEKAAAKAEVAKAAIEAVEAIQKAATQEAVNAAQTKGEASIKAVNPVGKEKALDAIQKAAEEKIAEIDKNSKLSDEEKAAAKAEVAKAATEAVEAIKKAATQAAVEAAQAKGETAIKAVNPVGKEKALDAIQKAAEEKIAEIDKNDKLSAEEKAAAKAEVAKAATEAVEAIKKAATQAAVEAAQAKGEAAIKAVNPVGKAQAKAAIDKALAEKEKAIDARTDLTDAEKEVAKKSARAEAESAKKAIDNATDSEAVEKALRTFLYQIDQESLVYDRPAFNFEAYIQALITGVVKVERGKAITQADIISKLSLPENVTVISIDLPDTNTLGDKFAKVMLRLPDGTEVTVKVPVRVVASQNGDSKPETALPDYGRNNGATNTDAKVDKAKLEGAIRQLDELIIQGSAKLDAETAKEATALLAEAKAVFANAKASQAEVDAMVKRIEDFLAKVSSSTDYAAPANTQAANARTAAKELPNTGTADSTVAMVAAAASALLGLGLAGRRRKEDEEA